MSDAALAPSFVKSSMSGQVDVSDGYIACIAGCMDKIKEVMVACSRNQEQQRNHIAELQKASNVQEQKLGLCISK